EAIVCTSKREASSIRELGYGSPISVVPAGVDAFALRAPARDDVFLAQLGVASENEIVTFLGRLSRIKGLDVLLRAFQSVARALPAARLVIAGPDDEGQGAALRALAAQGGISSR